MQQRIRTAFALVAVTCLTAVAAFAAVRVQFFTAECINDQLVSSSGPNTIRAFAGVDVVHGDAGFDTLSVQDFAAGDFVDGGPDSDSCSYDSGDTVTGC